MRIISEDETERICKCGFCGTKFAYIRKDILVEFLGSKYVACPICSNPVSVSIFNKKVKKMNGFQEYVQEKCKYCKNKNNNQDLCKIVKNINGQVGCENLELKEIVELDKNKILEEQEECKRLIKYYEKQYRLAKENDWTFYKKSYHRQINRYQSRLETLKWVLAQNIIK